MTAVVEGPAWSPSGLDIVAGRYPLAVEQHMIRSVASLVPGVTTVTFNARYYALHALAALEADRLDLEPHSALDLLRRMEVVMAGVSLLHGHSAFTRPHGADVIEPRLKASGVLDIVGLSQPGKGRYVQAQGGYWGPYIGSELVLGIIGATRVPSPGPRCDDTAVRGGLGDLVELAQQDQLAQEVLTDAAHLCLCQAANSEDGRWLQALLCAPPADRTKEFSKPDATRVATSRLLASVVRSATPAEFAAPFVDAVAFGPFIHTDPVARSIAEAEAWRGVALRWFSVGAWRRIWAWLVNELVIGLVAPETVADRFADELPATSVDAFLSALPPVTERGEPIAAEQELRAVGGSVPAVELGVLAVGGVRSRQLDGRAGDAFRGRPFELAPEWVARRFDDRRAHSMRDFGRDLAWDLLARGRRVAMGKMVRRPDGTIWFPTRLHEKAGLLYSTSKEGGGDVGLRIAQLGLVLAGVGVFDRGPNGWSVTETGAVALGV